MKAVSLADRAKAALAEVEAVRSGKWGGDRGYKRFGETLLDRYEALARHAATPSVEELQRVVSAHGLDTEPWTTTRGIASAVHAFLEGR